DRSTGKKGKSAGKLRAQEFDAAAHAAVLVHHVVHGLAGVDDGAVIAPAEGIADVLKRVLGQRAGEIHGDLARNGDVVGPTLARHVAVADLEVIGDLLLDRLNSQEVLRLFHEHVLQQVLRGRQVKRLAGEG